MQLTITGDTEKGNFYVDHENMLVDFCKKNADKKFFLTIQIMDEEPRKRLLSYIHVKIVPEWKQAYFQLGDRKTTSEIKEILMKISPITKNANSLDELNYEELTQFIDQVKEISLKDLSIIIDDPRILNI